VPVLARAHPRLICAGLARKSSRHVRADEHIACDLRVLFAQNTVLPNESLKLFLPT